MMKDCIFCKIALGEIHTEFLYEDEYVVAFNDIHPVKPVHVLVIPKNHIAEFIAVEDTTLYQHLFTAVKKIIGEKELQTKGYRIIVNGGGAQDVDHLHVHVMGPVSPSNHE
ncbi:MAG: histidine triad family protein [Patescibacteria group bacterium]|jgi:histidine triad (HIT) family protein|nr:histidine triad family protein [Patescibacteria group bacterium]